MTGDPLAIPSPWMRRFAHLVPRGGSVLDLAAGAGRHTRFFLDRRHPVVAVDRTLAGLADLTGRDGLTLLEADLEAGPPGEAVWPLGPRQFDCVLVTNYLWRPLLPLLVAAVAPGGVLLYETFAAGNEAFGRPSNPDYLLRSGELLAACAGLQVVGYEHGIIYAPRPSAVSRVAAVRNKAPQPL